MPSKKMSKEAYHRDSDIALSKRSHYFIDNPRVYYSRPHLDQEWCSVLYYLSPGIRLIHNPTSYNPHAFIYRTSSPPLLRPRPPLRPLTSVRQGTHRRITQLKIRGKTLPKVLIQIIKEVRIQNIRRIHHRSILRSRRL